MTRRLAPCLLLFVWLAACDQTPEPDSPRVPAPPRVENPSAAAPPTAKPEPPPKPAPVLAPKPQAPAIVVKQPPEPKVPLARKAPEDPQVTARQPPLELDLHLPQELLDAIEPYEALELEPLLPAFFGREDEEGIRLNGRLIESPTEERLFDGAELKIEIRR